MDNVKLTQIHLNVLQLQTVDGLRDFLSVQLCQGKYIMHQGKARIRLSLNIVIKYASFHMHNTKLKVIKNFFHTCLNYINTLLSVSIV